MKTCSKCRKSIDGRAARCPHCGQPNAASARLFRTSTVLISSGGADMVFRSVDEVPTTLRNKLLKSTGGRNSVTIPIVGRRGCREVAKAVYILPGSAQKRRLRSRMGNPPALARLAAPRRALVQALMALLAAAAVVAAVLSHWR